MGEYVNGMKLGACEDLYYVRFTDVQAMAGAEEYRDPANGYRYRFPFPDEDGTAAGDYHKFGFNRAIQVTFDWSTMPKLWKEYRDGWEHDTVNLTNGREHSSGTRIVLVLPCFWDKKFPTNLGPQRDPQPAIGISQQKQVDGELWTVIECSYCGAKIRLNKELAEELAERLRTYSGMLDSRGQVEGDKLADLKERDRYYKEVADRIMAGYH